MLMIFACCLFVFFFFSSRRRHTRFKCDWSSDVCSSDLPDSDWNTRCQRRYHVTVCSVSVPGEKLLHGEIRGRRGGEGVASIGPYITIRHHDVVDIEIPDMSDACIFPTRESNFIEIVCRILAWPRGRPPSKNSINPFGKDNIASTDFHFIFYRMPSPD